MWRRGRGVWQRLRDSFRRGGRAAVSEDRERTWNGVRLTPLGDPAVTPVTPFDIFSNRWWSVVYGKVRAFTQAGPKEFSCGKTR